MRKGLFIAVDANIGAGKTNACHAIASAASSRGHQVRVLEEPTHDAEFAYFLQRYYDDLRIQENRGGGFAMQVFMLSRRYEQHRLAVELAWGENGIVVIQDRPIYGDTVFATTATERGFMAPEEYELYKSLYRNMSRDIMPPDVFIYLDVPPEECDRRMALRARKSEEGVPLDYLQQLDKNYKLLLEEMKYRGIRTLCVDWTEFGPPVELWNRILEMAGATESRYRQLSLALGKDPNIPVNPPQEEE
jgi:deoxyadenosine/deoxycytidine kinase